MKPKRPDSSVSAPDRHPVRGHVLAHLQLLQPRRAPLRRCGRTTSRNAFTVTCGPVVAAHLDGTVFVGDFEPAALGDRVGPRPFVAGAPAGHPERQAATLVDPDVAAREQRERADGDGGEQKTEQTGGHHRSS